MGSLSWREIAWALSGLVTLLVCLIWLEGCAGQVDPAPATEAACSTAAGGEAGVGYGTSVACTVVAGDVCCAGVCAPATHAIIAVAQGDLGCHDAQRTPAACLEDYSCACLEAHHDEVCGVVGGAATYPVTCGDGDGDVLAVTCVVRS